jgi:hypothetical protein
MDFSKTFKKSKKRKKLKIMNFVSNFIIVAIFFIECTGHPNTSSKLTYPEEIQNILRSGNKALPVPKNHFEERYLQIVLEKEAADSRLALERELVEKRLSFDREISNKRLNSIISLGVFGIIFAVVGLIFGLINLGAGTLYSPFISSPTSKHISKSH